MKRRKFDLKNLPAHQAGQADDRLQIAAPARRLMTKVFPDHWSFLLGEIALYSFIVLVLTGVFLTLFFDPSMEEVAYDGSYLPLQGIEMSKAYASTLHLSFDVRGGLIMRHMHHWAANLFVAAILVHMLRIFFTGAFRKPREMNWVIGVLLFVLAFFTGFTGYSLPDDGLSGTGLRIASAITLSVPLIGTWAHFALFGGEFAGTEIIPRLYIIHVLILPGALVALISAHLALVFRQKHTQWPGPGRTEHNVVGYRMFPSYAAKMGSFFMITFGVIALMAGILRVNPIWLFGPYKGENVSSGSQPDWYVMFMDGMMRLFPAWEIRAFGYTVSPVFWAGALGLGVVIGLALVYPFLEAWIRKDRSHHNLLQRPRDAPARTALGAMGVAFYMVQFIAGGNDVFAAAFDISLNAMTWAGRIGTLLLPAVAYYATYRICLGLQQHDREALVHGVETGIIRRMPDGRFVEVHQPLGPVDEHGHGQLEYGGAPVPKKMNRLGALGPAVKGFFVPIEKPTEPTPDGEEPSQEHEEITTGSK